LQKVTIGFVVSVCQFVCPSALNNSPTTGQIFMQFDIWILSKIYWESWSFFKIWQE